MLELDSDKYTVVRCDELPNKEAILEIIKNNPDKPILIIVGKDKDYPVPKNLGVIPMKPQQTLEEAVRDYHQHRIEIPIVPLDVLPEPYIDKTTHGWNTKPFYTKLKRRKKK